MPLIDGPLIEIPDEDGWRDSLATRVLLVMLALLLMRMGFRSWGTLYPDYLIGAVTAIVLFAAGTQLMIFATMDLDYEVWGPRIAYATLGLIAIALLATLWRGLIGQIGTDAILFSRVAVEKLANGVNPYAVDMRPFIFNWEGHAYSTPRIDGTIVHTFSYPSGAVLWFLPQWLLLGETPWGIRLTLVAMAVATSAIVIRMLPPKLAIGGIVVVMGTRNLFLSAAGGILWPLWMLPLVLGFRAWVGERYLWGAFWVGISAGTKQFAWLILPFLAIWVWQISDGWRDFGVRAGKLNAVGGAVFLAMNGPFILWNSEAWLTGVLTPLSLKAPMVSQGVGMTLLTFVGNVPIHNSWHTLALGVVMATYLSAYMLYFDELKWAAWMIPPVVLIWHYRSLMSYFTPWAIIALLGAAAVWGKLRVPTATPADTSSAIDRPAVVSDD